MMKVMKINTSLTALALVSLLSAGAGQAVAAESATLTVGGSVITGACTPALSAGVVDYGTIPVSTLSQTAQTTLAVKTVALTVHCTTPLVFGMGVTDNRAGTAAALRYTDPDGDPQGGTSAFGLGVTGGGVNIGGYTLYVSDAVVDGAVAKMALVNPDGVVSGVYAGGEYENWYPRGGVIYYSAAVAPNSGDRLAAAQDLAYQLSVVTQLDSVQGLALTEDTRLDGSATLSLTYL